MDDTVISDDQPIDPSDERLVAYLDGELDTVARDQIEKELLEDDKLRHRLQDLQRGWDFLDEIPSATPSEKLVETTMELVVQDIGPPPASPSNRRSRRIAPLTFLAICLFSAGIGYSVSAIRRDQIFQHQMDELGIAEDLNAYLDGSDLELMRLLHENEDWRRVVQALTGIHTEVDPGPSNASSSVADTPPQQRMEKITQLTRAEMGALSARWQRYRNLPFLTRETVRRTAREVSDQPDAERLLNTMRAYSAWISILPASMKDAMQSKGMTGSTEEEVQKIRETAIANAIELTEKELPKRTGRLLSDESADLIMSAMRLIFERREQDPNSGIAERRSTIEMLTRRRYGNELSDSQMRDRVDAGLVMWSFFNTFSGNQPQELTQLEQEFIEAVLPQEDLDRLDAISTVSPFIRSTAIREMVVASANRKWRAMVLNPGERYELLSDEERLRLDLLPVEQIRSELTSEGRRPPRPRGR